MKIAVVGAGAMGCLFGGKLSLVADVWLVDPWKEHVAALQKDGLEIVGRDGTVEKLHVRAVQDPLQVPDPVDLALIFVKSQQTEWAAKQAALILAGRGLVLTLQNGLGNFETIAHIVGPARTLQGVTAHGATMLGPGRIRHAGSGVTHLATRDEISDRVGEITGALVAAGFDTHVSDNLDTLLWGKLVINVGINALTAILLVPNGFLADNPAASNLVASAVGEAVAVARVKNITLPYPDPLAQVLSVAKATGSNRSSMLQDVLRGAPTEISVINGAIVREGAKVGVATAVNQALVDLVLATEASYSVRLEPR